MDVLEITLWVGLLLSVGLNLVVLLWLAFADHNRRGKKPRVMQQYTVHIDGEKYLAKVDEAEIRQMVHDKLTAAATKAATDFEHSLSKTMPRLAEEIEHMNSRTLRKEFEKYQISFGELNDQALRDQEKLQREVEERRKKLITAVDKKIIGQYQAKLADFDERMAEVVTNYILESLSQPADLGAQLPAILAELERNKEQIKQDLLA